MSGYAFMADRILDLHDRNPQVASRLARCFDRWKKFDNERQRPRPQRTGARSRPPGPVARRAGSGHPGAGRLRRNTAIRTVANRYLKPSGAALILVTCAEQTSAMTAYLPLTPNGRPESLVLPPVRGFRLFRRAS